MANENKRYLVTYTDGSISIDAATKILGVTKAKCKDGVSFMESESIPSENDVLHFENLGVSTIELSENEAKKLAEKEGVLAVEEDVEMFALASEEDDDQQFYDLFMNSEEGSETDELPETFQDGEAEFMKGYNKALLDVFASILEANSKKSKAAFVPPFYQEPATPLAAQAIPWNITMVKAPAAWKRGVNGSRINVAILDTGITKHPDLVISGGVSFIPGSTSYNDLHGHGTHCAGIVAARNNTIGVVGVAPGARQYAVKVLSDSGSGQSSWIIAGMEWCVRNKMKVASMSLGGARDPLAAYANAVKRCQDNGVTVVVASGNSFGTSFAWVCAPANSVINGKPTASPIAVGSVDRRGIIAGTSSRGGRTSPWNQVWCVAPGVSINSTYLRSGYRVMSGTSMACPHVAGLAALIVQKYPGITPANVKRRIATTCTDLGNRGYDKTYGYGLINCDLATR